jgi:hypothetical protein
MDKLKKLIDAYFKLENEIAKIQKEELKNIRGKSKGKGVTIPIWRLIDPTELSCSLCGHTNDLYTIEPLAFKDDKELEVVEKMLKEMGEDIDSFVICFDCIKKLQEEGTNFYILTDEELENVIEEEEEKFKKEVLQKFSPKERKIIEEYLEHLSKTIKIIDGELVGFFELCPKCHHYSLNEKIEEEIDMGWGCRAFRKYKARCIHCNYYIERSSQVPIGFSLLGDIEKIEDNFIFIKPVAPLNKLKDKLPFKVVNDSFVIELGLPTCIAKYFEEVEGFVEVFVFNNKVIRIG